MVRRRAMVGVQLGERWGFLLLTSIVISWSLLTLPVTSASCECSHNKVYLVKSAVRSSMACERLESLIAISREKNILSKIPNSAIVARFATVPRGTEFLCKWITELCLRVKSVDSCSITIYAPSTVPWCLSTIIWCVLYAFNGKEFIKNDICSAQRLKNF